MRVTKISQKGIDLVKQFEGYSEKVDKCPAGIPTVGYGLTIYPNDQRVKMTDPPMSLKLAELYLHEELNKFAAKVDSFTRDDITQNQLDALTSFAYNLGAKALQDSTLIKKVNANPLDPTIQKEFMKWVNAGGRKLEGLVRRRAAEWELYSQS